MPLLDIGIGAVLGCILGVALGDDSIQPWHWMIVSGVGVLLIIMLYWRLSKIPLPRARSLSFSSYIMAEGTYPKGYDMCEPIINSVLFFDSTPVISDIKKMMSEIMAYDRFASPILKKNGIWTAAPKPAPTTEADMAPHLTVINVNDMTHMWAEINSMAPKSLIKPDPSKHAWWEMVLLKAPPGQRSAILLRIHHIIGDGMSLVMMVQNLCTDADGNKLTQEFKMPKRQGGGVLASIKLFVSVIRAAIECVGLAATPFDSPIVFTDQNKKKMKYNGKRTTLLLPDIELDFVKKLKDKASEDGDKATVNDILFGATSGAIREYCTKLRDPLFIEGTKKLQLRALLPIAFPRKIDSLDYSNALRNYFCLVSCPFAVNEKTSLERVKAVSKATDRLKTTPLAMVQLYIQNKILPYAPLFLCKQTVLDTFSRHSVVFTNVPGPAKEILFAGQKVVSLQMVFPNLISQMSMLSYAGKIYGNLVFDPDVITVKDPSLFRECYVSEIVSLASKLNIPIPASLEKQCLILKSKGL